MPVLIVILVIVLVLVLPNIKIVPQAKRYVVERLGSYYTTWENGLHFKVPFIDRIANVVSIKEQVLDFAPQPVITKDNVTMQIDTNPTVKASHILSITIIPNQIHTSIIIPF